MVYSTRRFVLCLTLCHILRGDLFYVLPCVLVFFCPFGIAITSLWEESANLSAFRTFVRFVLLWICRFPLPLGIWEGLRFVIVALPGFFSYPFLCFLHKNMCQREISCSKKKLAIISELFAGQNVITKIILVL